MKTLRGVAEQQGLSVMGCLLVGPSLLGMNQRRSQNCDLYCDLHYLKVKFWQIVSRIRQICCAKHFEGHQRECTFRWLHTCVNLCLPKSIIPACANFDD